VRADTAVRPYAEVYNPAIDKEPEASQRDAWWNVERVCREPDILVDGVCKQVDIRRLPGRAPSTMVKSNKSLPNDPVVTIGDGRPTGMHHATDQQSRTGHRTEFS
jgi:hypothetical protein